MRIPRIYSNQSLTSGSVIELDESASRHLLKVLRLDIGRELILFNGEGGEYTAEITATTKKVATVTLGEFSEENRQSPLNTHLAIGISRGDRFDWVLQKATELGVTQITPLFTERCEVKLKADRLEKKLESWRQITLSACEQCQRNIPPVFNNAMSFADFLAQDDSELKLVLHHRSEKTLQEMSQSLGSVSLLIGPEGGLSEEEIQQADGKGYEHLTIGPRVFRTETAPIVVLSLLQQQWGDF
ncbi:MAG: 16S rRNA (uracil(1498)-N(3))-methyltransferase [Cellvibrionaceae bacterium]